MSLIGREVYESAALLRVLALGEYVPDTAERPEAGELPVPVGVDAGDEA